MDNTANLEVRWVQGLTNKSIAFVDNKTVCYKCGNYICFLNVETKMRNVLQSPGRGVGALTANGNNRIFAFSEQKLFPSIFVYTFPDLMLTNELKGTAQLEYTSLALSEGGPYLACCSSLPDHIITVCVVELPATDGSIVKKLVHTSHAVSEKLPYFGPEMPPSAITGLKGDKAESIAAKLFTKGRLTPTAICWTATSQLYVGCAEGFLLLVDPESLSSSVLFNPKSVDAMPELKQCNFQGLTLSKNGLIAVEKESLMHCLEIKGTHINITKTWQLEGPVAALTYSPDYELLLLSSNTGQIYMLNPALSDKIVKVVDVLSGNFVAAAFLPTSKNISVITSLACCPIAQYAAVGTASGNVLFIDLNKEQQPRLVHQVHLYHTPVDHLVQVFPSSVMTDKVLSFTYKVCQFDHGGQLLCHFCFDREGHYLVTGASDSHVFVLDARPSKRFSVIGYTVVPGAILSLSSHCVRDCEQVKVLALCHRPEYNSCDGNLLTLLTLPTRNLAGPNFVDRNGCLSTHVLNMSTYEVPHPLQSSVLGGSEVFAYCNRRRTLQRFQLPQEHFIELQCHSRRLGGARSVSFSTDSHTLLTVGFKDGSLVCSNLRTKDVGAKMKKAAGYSQSLADNLTNKFSKENPILIDLPQWSEGSFEKLNDGEVSGGTDTMDVTEQDGSYNSQLSDPSHPTWLERKQKVVAKEETKQYSETKENLRKSIKELRDTIQEMMHENENLPDIERLEQHEFNLNVDEQRRLEAMVEEEASRVKNEIEWEILAKCYLHDVLKRECWDSMKFKGRAIKAFHSEHMVKNYTLKERTKKEMEDLRRVQTMRKVEKAVYTQSGLKKSSNTISAKEEEGLEDHRTKSDAVTGSFSAHLGYSNPYIYGQFSLNTTEQRINQIILLQDVIYHIKTAFNTEFEAVHKQKVQELNRVRDRNRHIREIMQELDMNEKLWEPSLSNSEWPERMLTVDDSEGDKSRERALDDMMDGVLEVKKDDILQMEIPLPEFVLTKPEIQWSDEEKKVHKEFEKKTKELNEEKEKYKKLLETEMKKLQAATRDATARFDETLTKLFEKKVKCEMTIYQEELKIAYLDYSVLIEKEMTNRELGLKLKLEKTLAYKNKIGEEVKRHEEELQLFQESYETIVVEDKVLDKEFRKEFTDVPTHFVDHLYKLFKRRPRVQKLRTQTDSSSPLKEQRLCGSQTPDALGKMLKAMEELDAPKNIPEGLNPSIWERFCLVRRTKVEILLSTNCWTLQVKINALTLAEMQAFLQKRLDEDKATQQDIKNLSDELECLHNEKNRFLADIMVQVLLKQGQVEVSTIDLTPDYTDSVLLHRSVVEDLNKTIRMFGERKIASMVECKDFRKGSIRLEWEHKMMRMQIEDLNNKVKNIQKLRLTEEQQDYLNRTDRDSRVSKQVSILEKTIAFQEKTHLKNVQLRIKKIQQLNRQAAMKAAQNTVLEQELPNMQVAVAEMKHIYEATASEEHQATKTEERYQEIVQKKKLKTCVKAQAEELAFLQLELERLRMKNFPSLDNLKHN
ncbi:Cilia- and flagella-associated protein 43 [Channa argus]|uniref:Cilia- and flagella-associated protein 43 n=1 Tax=Channa argus TaxID=215402 RepID=A0A6G1R108_CHAAH|nr:Cilia- and flagella-associated protein 43 [Channa argus]